mmetsp:Transcript_10924/g.20043  ORF Transcript_10924/g.20043 Transcript_10924/m.20043 type:complete len:143 (-) Transcript_10924:447-875(-)|eukprot:CAMPEP_0197541270 /NCGR_PEP_ID=MMETSP1318-20131121/67065_1 /TAXON_ID=552666 /ORGANISM="Partenskyella glossopodia, Strain RCC365" /LENGTH=142 /DNA_ID=CAMNT_0043100425 /DNA_START=981 /DNA_END=1409 /DNA_ORIENTATION=+
MASGIKVEKKAFQFFDEEFKKKHKYKFLIFELNKKCTKVVLADTEAGDKKANPTYEDFVKALCVENSPRWGVMDYEAKKKDGAILNKIVMFSWCQDTAKVMRKMLHGSTTNTVKGKLNVEVCFQASTIGEVDESVVKAYYNL